MANNTHRYGFRYVGNASGGVGPKPFELTVASAYAAQVSATDVDLNIGDPVQYNVGAPGSGFVELAAVGATPNVFYGVIVGCFAKVDANGKARPCNRIPAGTTWTTEETRSRVWVIPFGRNIWEIDTTGGTATTNTLIEYRAQLNRNLNLIYTLDVTNTERPKANPMLDLTTLTDDTADFRLVDVGRTAENQDYSGTFVKMRVIVNESGEAPYVIDPGV